MTDPTATVQPDVDRLASSTLFPAHWSVSGHSYDLETGLVSTVAPTGAEAQGYSV